MVIDNKFDIGQTVYLKTDKDQLPRMVWGFQVTETEIIYKLIQATQETNHFWFELSLEPNMVLKMVD